MKCKWWSLLYLQILAWSDWQFWRFSYFGILAWNCLFTSTFKGFWEHIIPKWRHIIVTPKGHLLVRKHVIWAIKRENRFNGSTWGRAREKKTGRERSVKKVTNAIYFTYLDRSPHWTDLHRNFHSSCRPWHNHVCKVLNWNCQGLRFYMESNFRFSYWFLHWPYNSAALMCCP